MSYVIDMPTTVVQEAQNYERVTGRSLQAMILAFVMKEVHRLAESDEWESKFQSLVDKSASRLRNRPPYKFNRCDAYPEVDQA